MYRTFAVANLINLPIVSTKSFRFAFDWLMDGSIVKEATGHTPAKARVEIEDGTNAEQNLDQAIATICAIYGQDFGARRLAKEIRRNRS
jgi:hypothetical protein